MDGITVMLNFVMLCVNSAIVCKLNGIMNDLRSKKTQQAANFKLHTKRVAFDENLVPYDPETRKDLTDREKYLLRDGQGRFLFLPPCEAKTPAKKPDTRPDSSSSDFVYFTPPPSCL